MRKIGFSGFVLLATLAPAAAASPLGNWMVEEKTAEIRIVDCGSALWGVISWEKVPGNDTYNPDAALRERPLLGSAILLGMKANAKQSEWAGKVYNAQDGKQYDAAISSPDDQTLNMRGCLFAFLCKTVTWTRVVDPAATVPTQPKVPAKAAPKTKGALGAPKTIDFTKDPDADICPTIPGALPPTPVNAPAPRPTH
jgi:uncharacterized protein (DUF2147 family)